MKERLYVRLTSKEVRDTSIEGCRARNEKLRKKLAADSTNIRAIRLVDDSPNWRGWIISYLPSES